MPASTPPEEVTAPGQQDEAYLAWRAATDLRAPYRVPPEFLAGTKPDARYDTHDVPLIVFINARSGGRVGPELASVLARSLGRSQVFDLSQHRPDKVLRQIWSNLQRQEAAGNPAAAPVRTRLRILACGGDGTVAWILKVIGQLGLQPAPAVAIMPLGTGNDLSRSFRWGAEFVPRWIKGQASIYATLKRVADARVVDLDCWRLRLLLPGAAYKPAKTYAMEQVDGGGAAAAAGAMRQAQQAQQQQQQQPAVVMEGLFYNYFSVGADAQAAYNFHHLRDTHPALAANRAANQFWYGAFSCTSGWFCGTLPSVGTFSCVEALQPGSKAWAPLPLPAGIKALVLVNLQSYGGGRNIWGTAPSKTRSWRAPDLADGLIEVVGFTHGYHAMAVMGSGAKLARGRRLGQVAGIRLSLRSPVALPDGEPGRLYMQLDGEPWMQPVPSSRDASVVLEIVHAGTSKLLLNKAEPDAHPTKHMTELLSEQQAAAYCHAVPADTAAADADAAEALHVPHHCGERLAASEPGPAPVALAAGGAAAAAAASASDGGVPCWQPHAGASSPAGASSRGASSYGGSSMDCPSAVAVIETTPMPGVGVTVKPTGAGVAAVQQQQQQQGSVITAL